MNMHQYNSLPSLTEASKLLEAVHVQKAMQGPIREIFLRHEMEKKYNLYLQHAHHNLPEQHTMIKIEGTAHVMSPADLEQLALLGRKIVPTTWMSSPYEEALVPMEYTTIPLDSHQYLDPPAAFLTDLSKVLRNTHCAGVLGLDDQTEQSWTEVTIGNASVVIYHDHEKMMPHTPADSYIPVSFGFDGKMEGYTAHGKCKKNHKHTSKPEKPENPENPAK